MADHDSEIDGLIDEHRDLMAIMGKLKRAVSEPDSDVDEILDQLEMALAHHTEREETGLVQTLHEVEVGPEYLGLFEHDHGHLVDSSSRPRDRQTVDDLLKSIEAHMLREENDMFPAAEQLLGPGDWDAVDTAVAHLRKPPAGTCRRSVSHSRRPMATRRHSQGVSGIDRHVADVLSCSLGVARQGPWPLANRFVGRFDGTMKELSVGLIAPPWVSVPPRCTAAPRSSSTCWLAG